MGGNYRSGNNILVKYLITILLIGFSTCKGQNADIDLLKSINSKNPSQYWITTSASAYIIPPALVLGSVAGALIDKSQQSKQNAYETVFSIGIGISLSTVIKLIVKRERPYDKYPTEVFPHVIEKTKSFPSGHTTMAFVSASTLIFQYGKWYASAPAIIWAGTVGYSRMKLGEHFPTDVLGGILVGAGSAWLGHSLAKNIK